MNPCLKYILIIFLLSSCAFEDPYFMTIEIYNKEPHTYDERVISIDEHWAIVDEIAAAVQFRKSSMDSLQKSKFFVKLKINKNVPMGIVLDVEHELRKAKIENIRYYELEGKAWLH